ncbi:phosphatidylinositol-4- kinase, partial [Nowakowskiella sp. JEL0407]
GDPVLLSELRELANLVRIICDRPDFHIITPTESSENQEFFSLFRNFWLYAVIYILSPSGHWPRDWNVMLTSIAAKTPPLLLAGTTRTLEAELGSHSILRGKFTESTVAKIKATLVSLLPAVSNESKNLTFFQSAYLLAVYQIESLRVKRTSTMYVSEYLKDEKLYGTEIYGLLEAIAEDITKTFTRDKLVGNPSGPEIESHMELLILDAAHRLGRVRKFGSRTINSILKSVPAVLWNSKLVSFLFDVLQYLDGVGNKKRGSRKSNILQKEIKFVNDQDAVGARQDYYDLALGWIYAANKRCNSDTNGLIARYLVEVDIKFPDLTGSKNSLLTKLINKFYSHPDTDITVTRALGRSALYTGEVRGMVSIMTKLTGQSINVSERNVSEQIQNELQEMLEFAGMKVLPSESLQQLNKLLNRGAALIISSDEVDEELLHRICWTPVILFSPAVLDIAVPVWSWIMTSRPDLALGLLSDLVTCWEHTILHRHGIYSEEKRSLNAFMNKMSYTPSSVPDDSEDPAKAHETWTNFLADRFRVARHQGLEYTKIYVKLLQMTGEHCGNARCSPAVREARWKCLNMGLKVVLDMEAKNNPFAPIVRYFIYEDVFQWFSGSPSWGWSRTELSLLHEFYSALKVSRLDKVNKMVNGWQLKALKIAFTASNPAGRVDIEEAHQVLLLLLENEMSRLATWHDPMDEKLQEVANLPSTTLEKTVKWPSIVRTAWAINPKMALQLRHRFIVPLTPDIIDRELSEIAATDALSISEYVEGLPMIMNQGQSNTNTILRTILYWAPATPIIAIALLGPNSKPHPWVLQFSTRSLEQYPIEQVFFYIPQMVQALRYDTGGYVEHFILNAAKSSQLFAHQIIWNMKANMYKEGEGKGADKVEDPLKPTLEKIIDKIVGALSGSDKEFYEREFKFFGEVTEISGKLKPYIHKSKAEKKKKIDEEIRKISVDVGVYLPSNPESIVVDIDYDSGRPLQSHAKAPFMATFKIKQAGETGHTGSAENLTSKTEWQSAIFKVGDDCRQDVLALQLVSIFKSIFTAVGADMYLFPYRVVATAPGCGVIEVIPRSISRDMMGREKVNDLFLYYIARFGRVESMGYKKAQNAFVKSLAAYSILLYILQIKDRHNGNIMFDDDGHIVHIDIVPGGVKFEASPFKLTTEMVDVMGGANSSSYQLLCQKIVQAYLAIRPYAEEIIHMVGLMMDSCLPCFKGEGNGDYATLKNLRDRFQLQLSERAAADFMIARIRESHENTFSVLYDEFQKLQNGIPYRA